MKKLFTILLFFASTYMLNAQCQASFGYQYDPMLGVTSFNGYVNTNDSNAYPITYVWMFGDGTSGTGQYLTHQYNAPGPFTVCLTASTANGCTSTFCDSIYISGTNPGNSCMANFYLDSVNTSSSTFSFIDASITDSLSNVISYNWSFGDGTTSTLQNPIHTFSSPGNYYVCLNITTSNGCTSSSCQYVYVNNGGQNTTCQASFVAYIDSISVPALTVYNFYDQSVPDSTSTIISWNWSFGNGTSSNLQNPQATLGGPGTYNVCLTITTNSGCTSTSCQNIIVNNTGCQIYGNLNAQSPTTIGGNDGFIESTIYGGTPNYTYFWSNNETTANIYNLTSGLYTLNVVDANGCQATFTAMLYEPYDTTGGNIVDTLTTNILDTCLNFIPDSFYIASITTDPNTNTVSVEWVFVGGGITNTLTVTYTYAYPGNNAIILTINCGTKALTSYMSFIHIYETAGILPNYGNETEILAFPVPFNNSINISSTGTGKINISIYDATGRLAKAVPTFFANGAFLKEVNTSNLPSGIYILNIDINGAIVHKQVIK